MFGFMKKQSEKEREDKERKKREKKEKKAKMEKPLTQEELARLEEAKRELYAKKNPPIRPPRNGREGPTPSESSDSISSSGRENTPDTYTSTARMDIRSSKSGPPTQPKPKKGILKGASNYGPEIPNMGVRGRLDDTVTLEENTNLNEILSGEMPSPEEKKEQERKNSVKKLAGSFEAQAKQTVPVVPRRGPPTKPTRASLNKPPAPPTVHLPTADDLDTKIPFEDSMPSPSSPAEKIYANIDLQLPSVAPPRCLKPRALELKRLPAGDFGFTLRRGTVLERGGKNEDANERKRTVIFAEPGPKNTHTGLLPGDRLIEVNGVNVEDSTREEIIELIKKAHQSVMLKVQPIPELSELSMRSGLEGEEVSVEDQVVQGGTLKRSGSIRFKTRQVSMKL